MTFTSLLFLYHSVRALWINTSNRYLQSNEGEKSNIRELEKSDKWSTKSTSLEKNRYIERCMKSQDLKKKGIYEILTSFLLSFSLQLKAFGNLAFSLALSRYSVISNFRFTLCFSISAAIGFVNLYLHLCFLNVSQSYVLSGLIKIGRNLSYHFSLSSTWCQM